MTASSKFRAAFAATAASAVLAAVPVVGAQPAHSQPYPPDAPSLTLTATTVDAGDDLGFTATGFLPNEGVGAFLLSKPIKLGRFTADANGTVEGTVTIPKWTDPGKHTFRLKGEKSKLTLSAEITVRSPKPHLADTGEDRSPVLLVGAAGLLALGAGTMMAVRRRKNS
ncbi:LPXTG cell wall anchor domain-containing protein [Streptomyces sp. TRM68367]|uniref:LPXTG cell wall anchor domain-containing protein n=1 Tax=Streptomyces sp. TRM68367 TaxID=2758415 RepID=UPI00165A286D|nr:LPXTG cell wall anchor domain-containing protein [Streptomyces sp. TRM68367]MBC9726975.1 LPXTG cell wall anchor domain-containing protein [Streptomyces sp. TRM68367]